MYQFLHTECYSNTASKSAAKTNKGSTTVRSVVAEATREPGFCDHVENPKDPIYLHGKSLNDLAESCENWAANTKDARGHKLRKDSLTLLAGVISAPAGFEKWQDFKADCVEYLQQKYGENLYSVVEHTDEANPHLHFYVVPKIGEKFEVVCDARTASAEAGKSWQKEYDEYKEKLESGEITAIKGREKGKKSEQNTAYKEAMISMQDDFFEKVSSKYGMLRVGPKRQRLTRSEYKAKKADAALIAKTFDKAKTTVVAANVKAVNIVKDAKYIAKNEADVITTEAKQIKYESKIKAAETLEIAEKIGFESGIEKAEKMPLIKKILHVFSKAAKERDNLKNEVKELKAENSENVEKSDNLLKRAKNYFKTAKKLEAKIKEIEPIANSAQRYKAEAATLKNEVGNLGQALGLARARVQHLEAAYLPAEPKAARSASSGLGLGSTPDPALSESRARESRYSAEFGGHGVQ